MEVLSVFLIHRGTNCAFPWYGDENCRKRHLLKSLRPLATIIIVFKGYSAWTLLTIFLRWSQDGKDVGRIGWLRRICFVTSATHFWAMLWESHRISAQERRRLCILKKKSLSQGSFSYYRCPSPPPHWTNLVHRWQNSFLTRELFTGKIVQVGNWVRKEMNLSSGSKNKISTAVGNHTVERPTWKTSSVWK